MYRALLAAVFDEVRVVQELVLRSNIINARAYLTITLTKIQAWKITNYKKCVFLDSDTLVILHAIF